MRDNKLYAHDNYPLKFNDSMRILDVITGIILIIGGLNWGIMALIDFNLIAWIFRDMNLLTRIIFLIIGLSAAYQIVFWKQIRLRWSSRK